MNQATPQEFLTIVELAKRWRICSRTIRRWIAKPPSGKGPIPKIDTGRKILFPLAKIEEWESVLTEKPGGRTQGTKGAKHGVS